MRVTGSFAPKSKWIVLRSRTSWWGFFIQEEEQLTELAAVNTVRRHLELLEPVLLIEVEKPCLLLFILYENHLAANLTVDCAYLTKRLSMGQGVSAIGLGRTSWWR